jgi:hypothetical protein
MTKKKTYGEQLVEHAQKNLGPEDDVREYRKVMERDIVKKIHSTLEAALLEDGYKDKDFYIVLMTKIERFGNAPRNYIFARKSCPTPQFRSSCWKYVNRTGKLEFLFSLPDEEFARAILANLPYYLQDKEYANLAKFVYLHESGELLTWVKKENGEKPDAIITIKEAVC